MFSNRYAKVGGIGEEAEKRANRGMAAGPRPPRPAKTAPDRVKIALLDEFIWIYG